MSVLEGKIKMEKGQFVKLKIDDMTGDGKGFGRRERRGFVHFKRNVEDAPTENLPTMHRR